MRERGWDVPDEPYIAEFAWYWEAYNTLASERHSGYSAGRIPWSAIEAYCDAHGLDAQERYLAHGIISGADNAWLREINRRQAAKAKQTRG